MKKLLLLLLLLAPTSLLGQWLKIEDGWQYIQIPNPSVSSSGSVATDAIWDAAGDLAVGTGADTAAKLTKGADGTLLQVTAGAVGWATLSLTSFATIAANSLVMNATGGAAAPTAIAIPTCADSGGNHLNYSAGAFSCGTSVSPASYPGLSYNPTTTVVMFEDFFQRPAVASTAIVYGNCSSLGVGTSSGNFTPTSALYPADGSAPGVAALTTGTTTTGLGMMLCGNGTSSTADSIVLHGGEIIEWRVYVPTASGGTNTHRTTFGLCDNVTTNGACTDEVGIYWDNNADTHWGCETISNTTPTTTLSTTVATAAAWHKVRIEVNANATSVAYKVDGSALSCSPIATNIPTGNARGSFLQARIAATAGCASNTTCTMGMDYVYFYQPGMTR